MRFDNNIQNLLKRVGLNQYESAVYTSLVSRGVSTVGEIAEASKVPRSRVYDVLGSLEKKGFSLVQLGRPVKYSAVKLDLVVEKLKQGAEKEYQNQVSHLDNVGIDLEKELGKFAAKQNDDSDSISIIRGEDNLNNHIKSMITSAGKKLLKLTDETGIDRIHKQYRVHLTDAKKRGVKTRVITNKHKTKAPTGFKNFAEPRANKKMNGRFLVKDGKESLLLTGKDTGIWVKGQYLANSLEQLFEHAWENSTLI
jgi:sugar-specific transcriptional regulator TrmB|tara:strand:- start:6255 stop:7013 length:759 start_codon:yes stop_codon:yes gene_type:complete